MSIGLLDLRPVPFVQIFYIFLFTPRKWIFIPRLNRWMV
jgi:hypothetical protein